MQSRDFCYWLQGFIELNRAQIDSVPLRFDTAQSEMIEKHLAMVFKHEIDPSMGGANHQLELGKIHDGDIGNVRIMC